MISSFSGHRVTLRSQLTKAAHQVREQEGLSTYAALRENLDIYVRERPELVILGCLLLGWIVGRRLSV